MLATQTEQKKIGRLQKRPDFLRIAQYSKQHDTKWVSKTAIIQIAPQESPLGLRYGITVTKKTDKLAVGRNRIKRRLRAALGDILPSYSDHNTDIVVIGRALTKDAPFEDIKNDIHWCLKRLGLKPCA